MKKKLKKGKWILTHERYMDRGIEVDSFDLFDTEERIHRPFRGKLKANNKGMDFPINRIPHNYTDKDYREMLDEQINNL